MREVKKSRKETKKEIKCQIFFGRPDCEKETIEGKQEGETSDRQDWKSKDLLLFLLLLIFYWLYLHGNGYPKSKYNDETFY